MGIQAYHHIAAAGADGTVHALGDAAVGVVDEPYEGIMCCV